MKNSNQLKIGLLLLVTFFIVTIFAFISYSNNNKTRVSNALVVHTNKVLYKSERVLSILKDVETATRGFVISGDDSFLQPYYQSKDSIQTSIAELKMLTKDNAAEQLRIDSLAQLARARLEVCKKMQTIRRSSDYSVTGIITLLREGKNNGPYTQH